MKTRSDPKGRNRPSTVFVIFLLFFLAAMMAEAGSASGERFTLIEAVRTAPENNHELQAQRNAHAVPDPLRHPVVFILAKAGTRMSAAR